MHEACQRENNSYETGLGMKNARLMAGRTATDDALRAPRAINRLDHHRHMEDVVPVETVISGRGESRRLLGDMQGADGHQAWNDRAARPFRRQVLAKVTIAR